MMKWNYRIIKKKVPKSKPKEYQYAIHEVFYNKKGKPTMVTER